MIVAENTAAQGKLQAGAAPGPQARRFAWPILALVGLIAVSLLGSAWLYRRDHPPRPRFAYVAARDLPAFHALTASTDLAWQQIGGQKAAQAAAAVRTPAPTPTPAWNPDGQLLRARVAAGDFVEEADALAASPPPQVVMDVALSAPGALSGQLGPGDLVDVYAAPQRPTPEAGENVQPVQIIAPTEAPLAVKALVLAIAARDGGYLVTLGLADEAGVAAIARLAPQSEIYLALRPNVPLQEDLP